MNQWHACCCCCLCRHTARFLILWLLLLPLALWAPCGWSSVPIVAIISFVLLGACCCWRQSICVA